MEHSWFDRAYSLLSREGILCHLTYSHLNLTFALNCYSMSIELREIILWRNVPTSKDIQDMSNIRLSTKPCKIIYKLYSYTVCGVRFTSSDNDSGNRWHRVKLVINAWGEKFSLHFGQQLLKQVINWQPMAQGDLMVDYWLFSSLYLIFECGDVYIYISLKRCHAEQHPAGSVVSDHEKMPC